MGSFYDVVAGNPTNAADVNQYADRLNGVTGAQVKHLSQNNATSALQTLLSAAPTTDQSVWDVLVSGDANARVSAYIRSADGYGGVRAGAGPGAATAHLYAQASGWQIPENLVIGGALNVSGLTTLAYLNASSITGSALHSTGALTAAGASSLDNGLVTTDGAGHLTAIHLYANHPLTLDSGSQEPGACGFLAYAGGAGEDLGYFVNFKTHLGGSPTSVTLTRNGTNSGNINGIGVNVLTTDGFLFYLTATNVGSAWWYGSYTTVGNCLLAVDTTERTFTHHCDVCGHISPAAPVSALVVTTLPGNIPPSLAYVCPSCGATEAFNPALTSADTSDPTPQGSGHYATTRGFQAALIRQLMTLSNLPLA